MMLIQLTDDLRTALDIENQYFCRQFGRYCTREDPVFWDASVESDTPCPSTVLAPLLLTATLRCTGRRMYLHASLSPGHHQCPSGA